jgi:hypothetical protein
MEKNFDFYCFVTSLWLLSLKNFASRRTKMTHKSTEKINKFLVLKCCWMFSFVSCSNLDVLYEGLGIFGHKGPGSRSGSVFSLKCWIRIRIKWMWIRNPSTFKKVISIIFVGILKVLAKRPKSRAGSGSVNQKYGSEGPHLVSPCGRCFSLF